MYTEKIIDEKGLKFDKSVLDEAYEKIKTEGKGGVVGPFYNELIKHEENKELLKYTDENGDKAPIPGGFCVVEDSKENPEDKNTIRDGLVI